MSLSDWDRDETSDGDTIQVEEGGNHYMQLESVLWQGQWIGWASFLHKTISGVDREMRFQARPRNNWNFVRAYFRTNGFDNVNAWQCWVRRFGDGTLRFYVYKVVAGGTTLQHDSGNLGDYAIDVWHRFRVRCVDLTGPDRIRFTLDKWNGSVWVAIDSYDSTDLFLFGVPDRVGWALECYDPGLGVDVDNVYVGKIPD